MSLFWDWITGRSGARHWWDGGNQSSWGFLDGNSTGEVEGNSSPRGVEVAPAIVPSQG